MTAETARFVGDIPLHYDRGLGPVIFEDYAADIAWRAALRGPREVLEIAAGTGIVTRKLRDALPADARLIATDLNAPMLEVAQAKFRPGEGVTFDVADALVLPFADSAFDAVVCQFGLMFFPDKDAAHREARRVLKAGGRYLFSVWDSPRHNPFSRLGLEVVEKFFPDNPPQFLKTPFSCPEIDPIKESLIGAGFTRIVASVLPRMHETGDVTAFANGLVFGSPLIDQIRARGDVAPEAIVDALVERFEQEFGAPTRMPMQAIFFEAERE
ncbi:methyltransferase domain-containing protein [Methylocystis sp. WRRC1]|uniref:class I SAM-dependent methyltransferase n=1 Tax=Methylocystis sp. WRRC1 TaxID=1732014 RepID=UPI001D152BEB|nr:methyltransferase domain-containing protein [Methylocystis sp. WRRC1]MCC3243928.1 methyltransferase domain-containing protein [Methylocystis sp. WRRC1]